MARRTRKPSRAVGIVDATHASIAENGIAGTTFEQVAVKAGVSRGLLHYHFASKSHLLAAVTRRDASSRVGWMVDSLTADTAEEIASGLIATLEDTAARRPAFFTVLLELCCEGRRNPVVRRELAAVFERLRAETGALLATKQAENLLDLPYNPQTTADVLQILVQGYAVQRLCEPARDHSAILAALRAMAGQLLVDSPVSVPATIS